MQCTFHIVLLLLSSFALGCQDLYPPLLFIVLSAPLLLQCPRWHVARSSTHATGDFVVHIGMCNDQCASANLWQRLIPTLLPTYAFQMVSKTGATRHEGCFPGRTRADNVLPLGPCTDTLSRVDSHVGEGTPAGLQLRTSGPSCSQALVSCRSLLTQLVFMTLTSHFGIQSFLSIPPLQLTCRFHEFAPRYPRPQDFASYPHVCAVKHLLCTRVGEATHPGPEDDTFALGCINPTGLNSKFAITASLPSGIFGVSETHLTSKGIQQFRKGSQMVKSPFSLHHGVAVPPRSRHSVSGEYSGVGFLAACPARAAPTTWPDGMQESTRVHVVNFFVQPMWILGAVIYGFPTCPHKTSCLLDAATQRVVIEGAGPRFLCGDFNLETGQVQCAEFWRSRGFIEIQDLRQRISGSEPLPTCKGKTRKDFCWISSELQSLFVSAFVDHTYFADHASLYAKLRPPQNSIPRFVWRMPLHMQKDSLPTGPLPSRPRPRIPSLQNDPDAYYLSVCKQYENDVSDYNIAQGKPPLGSEYRGRAATKDTKVIRTPKTPVPKGRQGEVAPAYFQPAVVYAQRFRQLRRLQALAQNLQKGSSTITAVEYRSGLWASILASTGFPPSFSIWWPTRPVKLVGDVQAIPLEIPTIAHTKALLAALEANIRHYEKQRQSASRAFGKAASKLDPALIFQDLRDPMPMSVETLLETTEAQVIEVDPQDFSITVDPPGNWSQALPLQTPDGPTSLIHVEGDKLWCDAAPTVQEGDRVRQENYMGSLLDIFRAFGEAWARRWQKHEGVLAERWDRVLHTIQPVPDTEKMHLRPITLQAWRDTVRSKNPRTSPGPDGISRLDLLAMPDDLTQFIIDICHHAEQTGSWPRAALQGVVSAIQKAHTSSTVNDFRPITIFSLIYRVWGSLRARQCLSYLHKIAPPSLFGNRPGVSASAVWYELQCVIESSSLDDQALCGFTADIIKAFNCIPRAPTLAVALLKGLRRSVVVGWTGALMAITRRFKVRSSVGPPLLASTGLPEGCAMSCVGMLLINMALHEFFNSVAPAPYLTTYVDNWACRASSPSDAQVACDHMHALAAAWDLQLDSKKLVFWATSPQCRRHLRQAGCKVALDFKELGAHVRFSRRKTNYTQTVRVRSLETRWGRLSASLSPYARKVSALKTAAWPRALHSISNVELGECHFSALRSGAMRGINAKAPGANPVIHLSLIEHPTADPAYFALQESFLGARRMAPKIHAAHTLDLLAQGGHATVPGPVAILLDRANAIGLPWHPETQTFVDEFGPLDLWECCPNELTFRLTWAWQQSAATKLQHRRGFSGLDLVDPALSRRALKTLTPVEKSMINVARNGTFFTQDALRYFQEGETPHCVHCGAVDSIRHRIFECPFFVSARQQLPVPSSELQQLEDFQAHGTRRSVLEYTDRSWTHGPVHRRHMRCPNKTRTPGCGMGSGSGASWPLSSGGSLRAFAGAATNSVQGRNLRDLACLSRGP